MTPGDRAVPFGSLPGPGRNQARGGAKGGTVAEHLMAPSPYRLQHIYSPKASKRRALTRRAEGLMAALDESFEMAANGRDKCPASGGEARSRRRFCRLRAGLPPPTPPWPPPSPPASIPSPRSVITRALEAATFPGPPPASKLIRVTEALGRSAHRVPASPTIISLTGAPLPTASQPPMTGTGHRGQATQPRSTLLTYRGHSSAPRAPCQCLLSPSHNP